MNDYDLVQIYKRMEQIDKELKELREEMKRVPKVVLNPVLITEDLNEKD